MRLLVVGSGDAFNSSGRGHSCFWLEGAAAEGPIMIDFGATALAALKRFGRDPRDLAGIAVTHLHGDHIGGFPFLILDGMYSLFRDRPLEVLGPAGVEARVVDIFRAMYGDDIVGRPRPFELRFRELAPGEEKPLLSARVRGFPADHMDPPDQPLCLRITGSDGRVVAFSGDTTLSEGLIQATDGADLLVAECSSMRPPAGRHCTYEEWEGAFERINVRRLLLTHLGWDVRERTGELAGSKAGGRLEVSFAEDGMIVEL